jgi:uncharacterized membrane-anchored protein
VLQSYWNYPEERLSNQLGMIVPHGVDLKSDQAWGLRLSYDAIGHVSDAKIEEEDFAGLLDSWQDAAAFTHAHSSAVESFLLQPQYDVSHHVMHLATKMKSTNPQKRMDYTAWMLGRLGVVQVRLVGAAPDLTKVLPLTSELHRYVVFSPGQAYKEHREWSDETGHLRLISLVADRYPLSGSWQARSMALPLPWTRMSVLALIGLFLLCWLWQRRWRAHQDAVYVEINREPLTPPQESFPSLS